MYAQGEVPGAWFGWQGLLEHGFSPTARGGQVTLFTRSADGGLGAPVPEPDRTTPLFCEGWNGKVMDERQAPFWIYGTGALRLAVSAIAETPATLWVDGEIVDRSVVADRAAFAAQLEGEPWHAVVLEVPELLPTAPPEGLRLDGLVVAPG